MIEILGWIALVIIAFFLVLVVYTISNPPSANPLDPLEDYDDEHNEM